VAALGKAIPPACERGMHSRANARKVIEVPGRPRVAQIGKAVADLIEDAADAVC
jgi:hypothetical protein